MPAALASALAVLTLRVRRVDRPQLALIQEVFELFDTNGEGQLDEEELGSAMFALGFCQRGRAEVPRPDSDAWRR